MHPLDPVDDPAYPGITATAADDLRDDEPQPGWDSDPALAGTDRRSVDVLEPGDAWAVLQAGDP